MVLGVIGISSLSPAWALVCGSGVAQRGAGKEWDETMQGWYYRDDTVRFYAGIISLDNSFSVEIDRDNYRRIERARHDDVDAP
ncbi:uncharacterized protein EKO05_0004575 [Ascochyta rabiei]|uniref:uncharacterized protein n=1 Tax=Didymella rabiei TaxID=5454 RepID=UPI0022047EB3|nr:uncharacterized protein EKO05_0004575 [Ascochyta rabiei]UPX14084.1 hypothetical protein EKO05_0004575 [Ascochyta rabiei]